jgi:phosphate transport system substrate-binding protein
MKHGLYVLALALIAIATPALARDQISIVGSSTVFPFSTTAAEDFGKTTNFATPVIESTGSGGGFKLFCAGVGTEFPDITNASRQVKQSEIDLCASNGVTMTEYQIGFDGIVVGNSNQGPQFSLTREQLYKAVSEKVYIDGALVYNPYMMWSDIDSSLPEIEIRVYGPPPTSGTRDAFVELVNHYVCDELYGLDKATVKTECSGMREDGAFIEAGENDNLIVQKLSASPDSLGIFGFSFLDQNGDKIHGTTVDGIEPTFEAISDGSYPISRSLFFYAKNEHIEFIPGLAEFIEYFMSPAMIGEFGKATDKGLIPSQ